MIGKRFLLNTTAIAIALVPGLLHADIVLNSHAGLAACLYNQATTVCGASGYGFTNPGGSGGTITDGGITTTELSVAVTPHSAWQPNFPDAVWIGAVSSGVNQNQFVAKKLNGPAYQITSETFTVGPGGGILALDVWADDTTAVLLNGVQIAQLPVPTNGQGPPACQGQPISCTPGTNGQLINYNLAASTYTLTFRVWQTGSGITTASNPTGLLYKGTVVAAPEAGELSMLISMLVGVAAFAGFAKKKLA